MTDDSELPGEFRPIAIPHAGFDVVRSTEEERERYRIPACPDPDPESGVAKLWARVFNDLDNYTVLPLESDYGERGRRGPAARKIEAAPDAGYLSWAGAVLERSRDPTVSPFGPFLAIFCEFDVPFVRPKDPFAPDPIGVAIWPGLDGAVSADAGSDILQAGVQAILWPNGTEDKTPEPQFTAWMEWFPHSQQSLTTPHGQLGPGDRISVLVNAVSPTAGYALVKNLTRQWAAGGFMVRQAEVEWTGGSAEWIVERLQIGPSNTWLPEFTDASLQDCMVVSRGPAPQIYLLDLSAATYIDMVVPSNEGPADWVTLAEAVPGAATTTVDVSWDAFGP